MASNLMLCAALAALSGLLVSIGVNITAYWAFMNMKNDESSPASQKTSCWSWSTFWSSGYGRVFSLFMNVVLSMAGILAFVLASAFGPVSIAMPFETGALLLSNLMIPVLAKFGPWDRQRFVGTLIVTFAVICVADVGPPDASVNKSVSDMLSQPLAQLTLLCIIVSGIISVAVIVYRKHDDRNDILLTLAYAVFVAVVTGLGAAIGKILTITSGNTRNFFLTVYAIMGLGSLGGGAKASENCNLSVYLPLNETIKLFLTAMIGATFWGDIPRSAVSYVTVYFLMCVGVYLCAEGDVAGHYAKPVIAEVLKRKGTRIRSRTGSDMGLLTQPEAEEATRRVKRATSFGAARWENCCRYVVLGKIKDAAANDIEQVETRMQELKEMAWNAPGVKSFNFDVDITEAHMQHDLRREKTAVAEKDREHHDYIIEISFDTEESLANFRNSPERIAFLKKAVDEELFDLDQRAAIIVKPTPVICQTWPSF